MFSWELPSYSKRQEPIAYFRGYGLDLTTLIVIAHVLSAIALSFAFLAGYKLLCIKYLVFTTSDFWKGYYWTVLTNPFYHDISTEHIWLVIGLALFWWFGRDLETVLGRKNFGLLYVLLILVPTVAVLVTSKITGQNLSTGIPYMRLPAHFAVFVAFCMVYPGLTFWPGIAAKWLALIYTGLTVLAILAIPEPLFLISFLSCVGTACVFVHFCGANRLFDPFDWLEGWKQDRALRRFEEKQRKVAEEEEDLNEAVNPILDKIGREGIQSLTTLEKQKLEKARDQLLQRERKKRP